MSHNEEAKMENKFLDKRIQESKKEVAQLKSELDKLIKKGLQTTSLQIPASGDLNIPVQSHIISSKVSHNLNERINQNIDEILNPNNLSQGSKPITNQNGKPILNYRVQSNLNHNTQLNQNAQNHQNYTSIEILSTNIKELLKPNSNLDSETYPIHPLKQITQNEDQLNVTKQMKHASSTSNINDPKTKRKDITSPKPEPSPKKIRHYDVNEAREYMKKQKERRMLETCKTEQVKKVQKELAKKKLQELDQVAKQLVVQNLQHKRDRSRSRENLNKKFAQINAQVRSNFDEVPIRWSKDTSKHVPDLIPNTVKQSQRSLDNLNKIGLSNKQENARIRGKNEDVRPKVEDVKIKKDSVRIKKDDVRDTQEYKKVNIVAKSENSNKNAIVHSTLPSNYISLKDKPKEVINKIAQEAVERQKAAIVIQAHFKGHRERRKFEKMKAEQRKHELYPNLISKIRHDKLPLPKEPVPMESPVKKQVPAWLQTTAPVPYPYNFINTVKKKLNLAVNGNKSATDVGIQISPHESIAHDIPKEKSKQEIREMLEDSIKSMKKSSEQKSFLSHNVNLKRHEEKRNVSEIMKPEIKLVPIDQPTQDTNKNKNISKPEIHTNKKLITNFIENYPKVIEEQINNPSLNIYSSIKSFKDSQQNKQVYSKHSKSAGSSKDVDTSDSDTSKNIPDLCSESESIKTNYETDCGTDTDPKLKIDTNRLKHLKVQRKDAFANDKNSDSKASESHKSKTIESHQINSLNSLQSKSGENHRVKSAESHKSKTLESHKFKISEIASNIPTIKDMPDVGKEMKHNNLPENKPLRSRMDKFKNITVRSSDKEITEHISKPFVSKSSLISDEQNNVLENRNVKVLSRADSILSASFPIEKLKELKRNDIILAGDLDSTRNSKLLSRADSIVAASSPIENIKLVNLIPQEDTNEVGQTHEEKESISYETDKNTLKIPVKLLSPSKFPRVNSDSSSSTNERSKQKSKTESFTSLQSGTTTTLSSIKTSITGKEYTSNFTSEVTNQQNSLSLKHPSVSLKSSHVQIRGNKDVEMRETGPRSHAQSVTIKVGEKSVVETTTTNSNQIHLKFEAELHLLNDFNESLRQIMAVEKSLLDLQTQNLNASALMDKQNKDTQTSYRANSSENQISKLRSITESRSLTEAKTVTEGRSITEGRRTQGTSISEIRTSVEATTTSNSKSVAEIRTPLEDRDRSKKVSKNKDIVQASKVSGQHPSINYSRESDMFDEDFSIFDKDISILDSRNTILEISELNNEPVQQSALETIDDVSSFKENLSGNGHVGLSLHVFEQLIREEDARIENLKTILQIREKALLDRFKGELAWLKIQMKCYRENGQLREASTVKKKQRGLIMKLQHETEEIEKLRQFQKKASKERKTLLRQQSNMIKSRLTNPNTGNMLTKVKTNASKERRSGPLKVYNVCSHTETIRSDTSISRRSSIVEEIINVTSHRHSIVSKISESSSDMDKNLNNDDIAAISSHFNKTEEAKQTLLMREAVLQKRRKEAEDLLQWHQRLLEEERKISELEMTANSVINQVPTLNMDATTTDEIHKFKGDQLNLLWHSMTGREEKKFDDGETYWLNQLALEQFCQDAKTIVSEHRQLNKSDRIKPNTFENLNTSISENNLNTVPSEKSSKSITTDVQVNSLTGSKNSVITEAIINSKNLQNNRSSTDYSFSKTSINNLISSDERKSLEVSEKPKGASIDNANANMLEARLVLDISKANSIVENSSISNISDLLDVSVPAPLKQNSVSAQVESQIHSSSVKTQVPSDHSNQIKIRLSDKMKHVSEVIEEVIANNVDDGTDGATSISEQLSMDEVPQSNSAKVGGEIVVEEVNKKTSSSNVSEESELVSEEESESVSISGTSEGVSGKSEDVPGVQSKILQENKINTLKSLNKVQGKPDLVKAQESEEIVSLTSSSSVRREEILPDLSYGYIETKKVNKSENSSINSIKSNSVLPVNSVQKSRSTASSIKSNQVPSLPNSDIKSNFSASKLNDSPSKSNYSTNKSKSSASTFEQNEIGIQEIPKVQSVTNEESIQDGVQSEMRTTSLLTDTKAASEVKTSSAVQSEIKSSVATTSAQPVSEAINGAEKTQESVSSKSNHISSMVKEITETTSVKTDTNSKLIKGTNHSTDNHQIVATEETDKNSSHLPSIETLPESIKKTEESNAIDLTNYISEEEYLNENNKSELNSNVEKSSQNCRLGDASQVETVPSSIGEEDQEKITSEEDDNKISTVNSLLQGETEKSSLQELGKESSLHEISEKSSLQEVGKESSLHEISEKSLSPEISDKSSLQEIPFSLQDTSKKSLLQESLKTSSIQDGKKLSSLHTEIETSKIIDKNTSPKFSEIIPEPEEAQSSAKTNTTNYTLSSFEERIETKSEAISQLNHIADEDDTLASNIESVPIDAQKESDTQQEVLETKSNSNEISENSSSDKSLPHTNVDNTVIDTIVASASSAEKDSRGKSKDSDEGNKQNHMPELEKSDSSESLSMGKRIEQNLEKLIEDGDSEKLDDSSSSLSSLKAEENINLELKLPIDESDTPIEENISVHSSSPRSSSSGHIDVKRRVFEILADSQNNSRGDKSPRLQDLYVTTYDVMSPEHSPESGSPINYTKFGDEAEELFKKQLAIEQEIKQLEQQQKEQLPYIYMREIPNKPPPPYTPPSSLSSPPAPSVLPPAPEQVDTVVENVIGILYTAHLNGTLHNATISEETIKFLINGHNIEKACFQLLFNLCKETAIEHYKQFDKDTGPVWMKLKRSKLAVQKPCDKVGLEKLLKLKVKQLLGFEKVNRKENMIIKWSRKKRDHVDELLVYESQAEESEWTNYDYDEVIVMNELTNDIMNMLISDSSSAVEQALEKKGYVC